MGKASYKKFKKQEKAKVKLKGNKAILPKGQNITDTNFKVKKIVVKEQLKEHTDNEHLTKKLLSFKELISRLSHHNLNMRQDALTGLKELISSHGSEIVQTNLSTLLQATMSLTIDREHDVRKDTMKLLSTIFENVTEGELTALFPVVISHLSCAMTHIEPSVRSDSLLLLDGMLAALPRLTAAHTPTLLPHFLDLISHQGSGHARSLSLHLDGRLTSDKWRCRVIGRLNRLFSVIIEHTETGGAQNVPSVKWLDDKTMFLGLYPPLTKKTSFSEDLKCFPIKEYATKLMPLLLDAFTEAVPKQVQEDSDSSCVVKVDVAALLQSIVEVVLHIWKLLKMSSDKDSLVNWFKKTWGEQVVTRMIKNNFPYSMAGANSRKRQRDSAQMLAALQVSEPSISLLNLQLCLLVFLLTEPTDLWPQCIGYITRRVRNGGSLKSEDSCVLCECLEAASEQPSPTDCPSLLHVVTRSGVLINIDRATNRKAFDYLSHIALQPSHQLHQDKSFIMWLDSLPSLLCKEAVPVETVRSLAAIAARNFPAFTNSLDGWIEEIVCNLPYLKVVGDSNEEGRKLIINLVYWVKNWDQELVLSVKNLIKEGRLGPLLTSYLEDILRFRAATTEDLEMKTMLEDIL